MNGFLSEDQGFRKSKKHARCLYANLDLSKLDYFKGVVDICMLDEVNPKLTPNYNPSPKGGIIAKED